MTPPLNLSGEGDAAEIDAYQRIAERLTRTAALDLDQLPRSRVLRRLHKRMRLQGLPTLEAYDALLATDAQELVQLAQHLLIPQAQVFRDPELYAALTQALPRWFSTHAAPRIWVPACGSGEEVVALALLMSAMLPAADDAPDWRIIGSDADEASLALARSGYIAPPELRAVPAVLRAGLELIPEGGARLRAPLLSRCDFRFHEVAVPPPVQQLDLIVGRGVLDSFEAGARREAQARLHAALADGGRLLVGPREQSLVSPELFAPDPADASVGVGFLYRRVERRRRGPGGDAAEAGLHSRALERIGTLLREAVIATDGDGVIRAFSGGAERLIGWRHGEAVGQPCDRVLHLLDAEGQRVEGLLSAVMGSGVPLRREDCTLVARDGRRISIRLEATTLDPDEPAQGAALVLADTTEQVLLSEQLAYRSTHDPVTGLVNRDEFERRLSTALLGARRQQRQHLFAYLDLDQFKVINDTLGHFAGDELLRQFSGLMRQRLRQGDTLARLGGDEFAVLLENIAQEEGLVWLEQVLELARGFRFHWDGRAYGLTVSIGVVAIDQHTPSAARALSEADAACFAAKDGGRNRLHVADGSDDFSRRQGEMGMVARINRALDHHRFELHFEDVVRCTDPEQVVYRELLVRLRDEERPGQLVPPNLFIPAAERFYLMGAVDRWVVDAALAGIARRPSDGVIYAVNLSGLSIGDEKFVRFLMSRFDHHGVAPEQICFEITETAAIAHLSEARRFIQRLAEIGCRFALDDFGAGMASFSYLRNLPVSYLKIDGSFVRSMLKNRVDRGMVEAINRIGHEMRLKTIAEHVEDPALFPLLADMGVDYAQGWAISRSRPFAQLTAPESAT